MGVIVPVFSRFVRVDIGIDAGSTSRRHVSTICWSPTSQLL